MFATMMLLILPSIVALGKNTFILFFFNCFFLNLYQLSLVEIKKAGIEESVKAKEHCNSIQKVSV